MTPSPSANSTLVEVLLEHVSDGDAELFRYLTRGEIDGPVETLTRHGLAARARSIAAWLQARNLSGERVLLLYPPGLGFIEGFFGCLLAGAVAVPAYPPDPRRLERSLDRLLGIVRDCQPRAVFGTRAMVIGLKAAARTIPEFKGLLWAGTETIADDEGAGYLPVALAPDQIAFLQYTSGSTGAPKGVAVTHGNLTHNTRMIGRALGLAPGATGVSWLPVYHDMGLISKVITPVQVGGSVTLFSPLSFLERPLRWLEALSRTRAEISGAPNFAYDLCARQATDDDVARLDLSAWRIAVSGAEPVRAATLARFAARFAPAGFRRSSFLPAYGLAEATLFVTGKPLNREPAVVTLEDGGREHVACGEPVDLDVQIVDPATRSRVPAGATGEVWVAGASVAHGYWQRPAETAETFAAHLASGEGPFLRTGDLGRWHGGELVIEGRLKDLLIIRGRNHHPVDLEHLVEAAHPGVRAGGVAAFGIDVNGEERLGLVAEVRAESRKDAPAIVAAIREALAQEAQISPARIALLPARTIPKTTSGKIRRSESCDRLLANDLPSLIDWHANDGGREAPTGSSGIADPVNIESIEAWLRDYVATASGTEPGLVDLDQSAARYGLDSLSGVSLAVALGAAIARDVAPALVFEAATLRGLARAVAGLAEQGDSAHFHEDAEAASGVAPVSRAQRRMWLVEQMHPGTTAYHLHVGVRLPASLDAARLDRSLATLAARHAMLRASFAPDDDGQLTIRVADEATLVASPVMSDAATAEAALTDRARQLSSMPFDWSRAPLVRLERVGYAGGSLLVAVMPHVAADGVSLAALLGELAGVYDRLGGSDVASTASSDDSYLWFCAREYSWLASNAAASEREWWRAELAGAEPLRLPVVRPPVSPRTTAGGTLPFALPASLGDRLRAFARLAGVTPFAVFATGLGVLLQQYCGQDDFVLGTIASGRASASDAATFGLFVNPLPVRLTFHGDPSFQQAVAGTSDRLARALSHQRLPYDEVINQAAVLDRSGLDPLIHASVVMTPAIVSTGDWAPLLPAPDGSLPGHAKTDLSLQIADCEDGGVIAAFEYSLDRFDDHFVRRLAKSFEQLLTRAMADPSQPLSATRELDADSRREVLGFANGTPAIAVDPGATVHGRFEAQVDRTPDAVAISCGQERLIYRELDDRANGVALWLWQRGVRAGDAVGIIGDRTPGMVIAMLAALKAGAAYVPLDPTDPPLRLQATLRDANVNVVLGQVAPDGYAGEWGDPADRTSAPSSAVRPAAHIASEELAYIIYTSGSTGAPKGVMVEHAHVVAFLDATSARLPVAAGDAWLAVTRLAFDPSVLEILWPLTQGMRVVIGPDPREIDALAELLASARPTHLTGTPSLFAALLERDDARLALSGLKELLVGGEAMSPALARALTSTVGGRTWNMYGPTETVVDATGWLVDPDAPIVIGKPLANTSAFVLDAALQLVPIGVVGELYLGGGSVARGYWRAPELTAARFVGNPFGPGRLFRTGDRVRWTKDGELEFLGRSDGMVKFRGFRIELGEIASAIAAYPGVNDVHVAVDGQAGPRPRLVAYVAGNGDQLGSAVRSHLATVLSAQAVPAAVVVMDTLPRTANGKIDAHALPMPAASRQEHVAPRTPEEGLVVSLAESLLGRAPLSATEHFFEAGGDSLLAVQLLRKIAQSTGRVVAMREFYEQPTLDSLARRLAMPPAIVPAGRAAAEPPEDDDAEGEWQAADAAAIIEQLAARVPAAGRRLHEQLGAGMVVARFECGPHQRLALEAGYRQPLLIAVAMPYMTDADIQGAVAALFEQQALLRTTIERQGTVFEFIEHSHPASLSIEVLDALAIAPASRDVLRTRIDAALHDAALASPALGAFQVHAVVLRLNRRLAEVRMILSQAITDRASLRILGQLLPAGGRGDNVVTQPYRDYLAGTRRSTQPDVVDAFKASAIYREYRMRSLPAKERFPLGPSSVHSGAWRLSTQVPLDAGPMQEGLAIAVAVLRIMTGEPEIPLRVLTHRRLDHRARHFLTVGDFHDSVPVLFKPEEAHGSCQSQFSEIDRWVRSEDLHISSLGVDAAVVEAIFDSPFNFNFVGDLSEAEERLLLAGLAPLPFIAYPILAYSVEARLEVVLLHGLPATAVDAVAALMRERGGTATRD